MAKESGLTAAQKEQLGAAIGEEQPGIDLDKDLEQWALALEQAPLVCARLGCINPPEVTCQVCGTNYCEAHPCETDPLCEACHLLLAGAERIEEG